jgi:hypothetical protein
MSQKRMIEHEQTQVKHKQKLDQTLVQSLDADSSTISSSSTPKNPYYFEIQQLCDLEIKTEEGWSVHLPLISLWKVNEPSTLVGEEEEKVNDHHTKKETNLSSRLPFFACAIDSTPTKRQVVNIAKDKFTSHEQMIEFFQLALKPAISAKDFHEDKTKTDKEIINLLFLFAYFEFTNHSKELLKCIANKYSFRAFNNQTLWHVGKHFCETKIQELAASRYLESGQVPNTPIECQQMTPYWISEYKSLNGLKNIYYQENQQLSKNSIALRKIRSALTRYEEAMEDDPDDNGYDQPNIVEETEIFTDELRTILATVRLV